MGFALDIPLWLLGKFEVSTPRIGALFGSGKSAFIKKRFDANENRVRDLFPLPYSDRRAAGPFASLVLRQGLLLSTYRVPLRASIHRLWWGRRGISAF
jgi:hypothetical protein